MADAEQVTLNTIRGWAERNSVFHDAEGISDHARGYGKAARDILKILEMHGRPAHEPVDFGE